MQFVLDDERWWQQPAMGNLEPTSCLLRWPPETSSATAGGQLIGADIAKEGRGFTNPRQGSELIDRGDQEAGQAAVDLLIHRQHR